MTAPSRLIGQPGRALQGTSMNSKAVEAGISGEQALAGDLVAWAENNNAYVFASCQIPGKSFDADFLILVGSVVIHVDAKNWRSRFLYHFEATDRGAFVVRKDFRPKYAKEFEPFQGGTVSMSWENESWSTYLGQEVIGVLALVGPASTNLSGIGSLSFHVAGIDNIHSILDSVVAYTPGALGSPNPRLMKILTRLAVPVSPSPALPVPSNSLPTPSAPRPSDLDIVPWVEKIWKAGPFRYLALGYLFFLALKTYREAMGYVTPNLITDPGGKLLVAVAIPSLIVAFSPANKRGLGVFFPFMMVVTWLIMAWAVVYPVFPK